MEQRIVLVPEEEVWRRVSDVIKLILESFFAPALNYE